MQLTNERLGWFLKNKVESVVMNGQYIRNVDRQLISEEVMFQQKLRGHLKADTESET